MRASHWAKLSVALALENVIVPENIDFNLDFIFK